MNTTAVIIFSLVLLAGCASNDVKGTQSIFDQAAGTWDEEDPTTCLVSHTISFADNFNTMIHAYEEVGYATETDSRKLFRYSVTGNTESEFFAQLEDEQRLTDGGNAVIWIFRLIDNDNYCWGRVDWPIGSCTPKRMRCKS